MDWTLPALFGALALFWLSTRQFATLLRLAIWAAGASSLAWAAFCTNKTVTEFGLRQALEDAWIHRGNLHNAVIVQALQHNAATVTRFIPQLSDFFLFAGALMGALALLAFTRGERIEQRLRPTILALAAFIAGSAATLAVVAIGLGGHVKPRTYIGQIARNAPNGEPTVHDGDTFLLGDVSLRLWGVDAPELSQECRGSPECAEASRTQLESFLVGKLVQCDQRQSVRSGRWVESFGRPLVQCRRISEDERIDVGAWMIQQGFAVRYEGDQRYYPDETGSFRFGCALRPDVWRRNQRARAAFEANQPLPEGAETMGNCPPTTASSPASPRE